MMLIRVTITILIITICKSNVEALNLPDFFEVSQDLGIGDSSLGYNDEFPTESSSSNWNSNGNKKASPTYAAMVVLYIKL